MAVRIIIAICIIAFHVSIRIRAISISSFSFLISHSSFKELPRRANSLLVFVFAVSVATATVVAAVIVASGITSCIPSGVTTDVAASA